MHLTTEDKLRIFFNDASAFVGILFGVVGVFFAIVTLDDYDFSNFRMAWFRLAQTTGTIIRSSPTEQHVNDSLVINYTYQYQAGRKTYTAHSFSEVQHWQPGTSVAVEYIPAHPDAARIRGMRNAPAPFWTVLILPLFAGISAGIVFLNWRRTRRTVALASNPFITVAVCQRLEDLDQTDEDGRKNYRAHYQYTVGNRPYTHELTTTEIKKYGVEEPLVAQFDQPENARLATDLPDFIWQRLRRRGGR